jgi:hypothetical protein
VPFLVIDPATAAAAPATTLGAPKVAQTETLSTMRAWLKRALLGRTQGLEDATFNEWINDAYLDICTSLDIDELKGSLAFSLTAGQSLYKIPSIVSTFLSPLGLVDSTMSTGGQPLDKVDKSWFREQPDESNRPKYFFREGELLVIHPTPDKSYTLNVDFRIRPLPMTLDTHSPILSAEWYRPIRLNARQMAFDDLQEFEKVPPAQNSVVAAVRKRNDREASEDEGRVVKSSVPGRGRQRSLYDLDRD